MKGVSHNFNSLVAAKKKQRIFAARAIEMGKTQR